MNEELRVELVRFYLHDWGFACSAFFAYASSADLLLAIAWLFASSAFFERLHVPILEVPASYFHLLTIAYRTRDAHTRHALSLSLFASCSDALTRLVRRSCFRRTQTYVAIAY